MSVLMQMSIFVHNKGGILLLIWLFQPLVNLNISYACSRVWLMDHRVSSINPTIWVSPCLPKSLKNILLRRNIPMRHFPRLLLSILERLRHSISISIFAEVSVGHLIRILLARLLANNHGILQRNILGALWLDTDVLLIVIQMARSTVYDAWLRDSALVNDLDIWNVSSVELSLGALSHVLALNEVVHDGSITFWILGGGVAVYGGGMEETSGLVQKRQRELVWIVLRSVVSHVAAGRPHLNVIVVVWITHQILVILNDLGLLKSGMLFLKPILRRKIRRHSSPNALSRLKVFLVAFIILEETLIDSALAWISPGGNIDVFITNISLRFLAKALYAAKWLLDIAILGSIWDI